MAKMWMLLTRRAFISILLYIAISCDASPSSSSSSVLRLTSDFPDQIRYSNSSGLRLRCSAEGNPAPTYQWFIGLGRRRRRVVSDDEDEQHEQQHGLLRLEGDGSTNSSILVLSPFSAADLDPAVHDAHFGCEASGEGVGVVASNVVRAKAVLDQAFDLQVLPSFAFAGGTAVLRCLVPPFARDSIAVEEWIAVDRAGRQQQLIRTNSWQGGRYSVFPSTGELHIRAVSAADAAKSYRCLARNTVNNAKTVSSVAGRLTLRPSRPSSPSPLRMESPRPASAASSAATLRALAEEGTDVELPCAAVGAPAPKYTWFLNGRPLSELPSSLRMRATQLAGSLLLSNATAATAAGRWTCRAENTHSVVVANVKLDIFAPLRVSVTPRWQRADVGTAASLRCEVRGFPVAAISWLKDGIQITRKEGKNNRDDLVLASVTRSDRGVYQCLAEMGELDFHSLVGNRRSHPVGGVRAQASAMLELGDASPVLLPTFYAQIVRPGQSFKLECVATGNPAPNLRWTVDGEQVHESDRLTLTRSSSSNNNNDEKTSALTLTVANALPSDAGHYACAASNYLGSDWRRQRLDVLGPPSVRPMGQRAAVAGRDFVVHCPYGGHPLGDIEWSKNGESLPVNERQSVFANGTLIIRRLTTGDAGSYTCTVHGHDTSNGGRPQEARSDMELIVRVAPRIEPFRFKSGLQEGGRARVACTANLGDLPITFRWLFGSAELPPSNDLGVAVSQDDQFSSSISFPNLETRHSGNYTCVASNSADSDARSGNLVVNIPPRWQTSPVDASAMLGEGVRLDCAVTGVPQPRITWAKDSDSGFQDVHKSIRNFMILSNGTLVIEKSEAANEGKYLCKAENGVGEPISKLAKVDINVPAHFASSVSNQTVTVGSRALIDCDAAGDNPIDIGWSRNGKELRRSEQRFNIQKEVKGNGSVSTLAIRKTMRSDTAVFTCRATNSFGSAEKTINLIVQEPPETPRHLRVVSSSSRTANLTWDHPFDGRSEITSFLIQYKKHYQPWSDAYTHSCSGASSWTELHTLSPASAYHLRAVAVNSVGRSAPTAPVAARTAEEAPGGPPMDVEAREDGSQAIRVKWRPPVETLRHGKILGYYLGYKATNSTDPFRYQTLEVSDTTVNAPLELMIPHLKKFTRYSLVVQAFNRMGAGPRNKEVVVSTGEDVPSAAPESVQCSALSSTSLMLRWSPPPRREINGRLKEYRVFFRPLREWEEKAEILEQSTLQHQLTLGGLDKFQNYSVQVSAATKMGLGLKSRSVYCRTKEDVPDRPADIKAVSSDGHSVLVSWLPPSSPNGRLTRYSVYMRTMEGGRQFTQHFEVSPEETNFAVRGLNQNQPYSFWVRASTSSGDGPESEIVSETPTTPVAATAASFSRVVVAAVKEEAALPCVAVGQPNPDREWSHEGTLIVRSDRFRLDSNGETLRLFPLELGDAGNYTCEVSNHFGRDSITYTLDVRLSRNNGVPPAPPTFTVSASTPSSITLSWSPASSDGGSPLLGYRLHFHREFGDWDRVEIAPDRTHHSLSGLKCGTNYQFYIQAVNDFGVGDRTDTASARTTGSPPFAPTNASAFIRANSTSIALNLLSWRSGGCPISSFVIEYKRRDDVSSSSFDSSSSWVLVNNNVKLDLGDGRAKATKKNKPFLILDLHPETRYTLRVTAHNAAGSTVREYNFTTLTFNGATVAPELIIHSDFGGLFLENPSVMLPLFLSVTLVTVAVVLTFHHYKKRLIPDAFRPKNNGGNRRCLVNSETNLMSELQNRQSASMEENGFKSSLHQLSTIPTQQQQQQQQQQFNPSAVATLDRRLFQQQQLGRRRQRGNEYVIQPGMGFACSPMNTFGRAQKPSFQINASATNLLSGYHDGGVGGAPCHIILDHQQTLPQQTPLQFYSSNHTTQLPSSDAAAAPTQDGSTLRTVDLLQDYSTIKFGESSGGVNVDANAGGSNNLSGVNAAAATWVPMTAQHLYQTHRL